jgi:glutaredoxin
VIEIWGKDNCVFCVRAKALCETRNFKFEYKQLGVDFEREDVLEAFPGARTFPQIKVGGTIVGSYDDFVSYIENTGYTGTGHTL